MMLDERISAALRAEADATEVDVQRLHAQTVARLRPPRRRRHRILLPILAGASATAVLVLASVAVTQDWFSSGPDKHSAATAVAIRGGVSRTFTCPVRDSYDFVNPRPGQEDDFLPSLAGGPQAAAAEFAAPRYDYREGPSSATLWLGESDGSLASKATFSRTPAGDWELASAERCAEGDTTILTDGEGRLQLGLHGTTPWPTHGMVDEGTGSPVLIDDRSYYGDGGVAEHRTMYATPCPQGLCLVAGKTGSMLLSSIGMRDDFKPFDISSMFLPPDAMVGRTNPFGLWAVYDTTGTVTGITLNMQNGSTRAGEALNAPDWSGSVWVALAMFDQVESVTVTLNGGESSTYSPEELPRV